MVQKDTCIPVFFVTLFTIAETWTQPKGPSTGEWIKKMQCVYTKEYYSATKKNKSLTIYNKINELTRCYTKENKSQKDKHYKISLIYGI